MSSTQQQAELERNRMLSHGATLINLSSYGPTWSLIYAAQEMVKAGYTDDEITGWLDFALSAERASQEQSMNETLRVGDRVRRNYGQNRHIAGTVKRVLTHDAVRVQWDNLPHRGERLQTVQDLIKLSNQEHTDNE